MKILVTGCAGFIGFHLSKKLLSSKKKVYGIDNLNNYYDNKLKKNRLKELNKYNNFNFFKINLKYFSKVNNIIRDNKIKVVIHLAAQAGVRNSIDNPKSYVESNLLSFFNILDSCKKNNIRHFLFASSSSVYGDDVIFPSKENSSTDKPLSFYGATKKSNELMAYSYSNIYKLPSTALRFFTVYGPSGRPDMSLYKFTEAILKSKRIDLFNNGKHIRDFTYIDDVILAIVKLIKKPSKKNIPYNCFNIGSNNPKNLLYFLKVIENHLNKKTNIQMHKIQKGEVIKTHADIRLLKKIIKFQPKTNIKIGIKKFIDWYKIYYKLT